MVTDAGNGLIAAVVKDAESLFFRQSFHVFALTAGGYGNAVGNEVRVVQGIGNKKHPLGGVGAILPQGSGNDAAEVFFPAFSGIGTQGLQKTVCAGMVTVWISKSFSLFTRSFSFSIFKFNSSRSFSSRAISGIRSVVP